MATLKTLFLLLFCSISTLITAQQYIGFKIGFPNSHSDFKFDLNSYDFFGEGKARPNIMVFSELEATQHYSFTPNVHFAQTGNLLSRRDSIVNNSSTNRIDYIGAGLINKLKLFSNEYEVYGLVGPQFRWAIGGSMSSYETDVGEVVEKIDFQDISLKRFDMNIRTGVGLGKVNPAYKIILEWIYDISFFDVNSNPNFASGNYKNMGLLIGLEFKLNKENEEQK